MQRTAAFLGLGSHEVASLASGVAGRTQGCREWMECCSAHPQPLRLLAAQVLAPWVQGGGPEQRHITALQLCVPLLPW